jgi:hypothetical protein
MVFSSKAETSSWMEVEEDPNNGEMKEMRAHEEINVLACTKTKSYELWKPPS